MLVFSLLVLLIPAVLGASFDPIPKELSVITVDKNPAFCSVVKNTELGTSSQPVYDLIISNFSPNVFNPDTISRIEAFGFGMNNELKMSTLVSEIDWPNEVTNIPDFTFSRPYVLAASTGFFVPTKDDGSIALMDMTDLKGGETTPVIISSNPSGIKWYYHRVEWHDMNGDGYLDAVTERANGGGPAANTTQLVWFENPRSQNLEPNWDLHVIKENVEDVHFRIHDIPYNGGYTTAIISSGFYSNQLTIVWSTTNDFTDSSSIQTVVVDNYGWYFDVEIVDVNNDGKLDVLTSTWSQQRKPGAVIAYEIPEDWTTEPWTRHILQGDYHSSILPGAGSPGAALSFYPVESMRDINKPFIMVSGDDDGSAYVLAANFEDPSDWSYNQSTIYKGSGTIGGIAVKDVNDDGYADVIIPAFTQKEIVVMTYNK